VQERMRAVRKVPRVVQLRRVKKRLHDLWSWLVRDRDGWRCIFCGKGQNLAEKVYLQAHHWIVHAAGSVATRFILGNGVTLCWSCHKFHVHLRGDAWTLDRIRDHMRAKGFITDDEYDQVKFLGKQCAEVELEDLLELEQKMLALKTKKEQEAGKCLTA